MKQKQLEGYQPAYPKKVLRGAVLTTAAVLALGTATGCKLLPGIGTDTTGIVPIEDPTPELVLDGEIAIDEPTDEPQIEGYVMPEPTPEELILDGDVAIDDGAQP